jgi:hypothetical protein
LFEMLYGLILMEMVDTLVGKDSMGLIGWK